jgi:chromosome segregation ATPase
MEFEQIVKQLEWLDEEQRKSKETLAGLGERLTSLESTVDSVSKQLKTMNKQLGDFSMAAKRLNQFDELLAKQRADLNKIVEENDKRGQARERETARQHQSELESINKTLSQLFSPEEMKKKFKERADETQRLANNMNDFKARMEDVLRASDEVLRVNKNLEDSRRSDLKRLTDIQGELTAMRKRVDESREKSTLNADNIRNIENRISELLAGEMERKQSQSAFVEQQARAQVERDRAWKDWREKYETFQKEAESLDSQVHAMDETMRGAKKAQDTYLELNTKLERRISEVTEMQRLAEDRLRQEWVSFKADDQKRWTGYSLSSEESLRDLRKEVLKLTERATALDDTSQVLQDQLHQTTDITEQQLQEMMNLTHEWMTAYQRIMGHGKKGKK